MTQLTRLTQPTRPSTPVAPPVRAVRVGGLSVAVSRRYVVVCGLLLATAVLAGVAALLFGEIQVGLPRLVATIAGDGTPFEDYLIWDSRLPRVVSGALIGAALAISGAMFQTVSRNPLGSPDVIGFETGAASGGLIALLLVDAGVRGASVGAILGGLATALVVFLLAMRGGLDSLRLVLVGIGVGAMLISLNSMLIVESNLYDAQSAAGWLVGNVAGASWAEASALAVALAVLGFAALLLSRPLAISELADDSAAGLGLRTTRVRLVAVVVGVLLSSIAVAAAGPIAFIALTAPQVARRLTRASGPNIVASAVTGTLLLVLADHAARELFQPRQLPVGVMTGLVGGLFLAWLLTREWRKGRV
jgi:iron complex transport system permease protein